MPAVLRAEAEAGSSLRIWSLRNQMAEQDPERLSGFFKVTRHIGDSWGQSSASESSVPSSFPQTPGDSHNV